MLLLSHQWFLGPSRSKQRRNSLWYQSRRRHSWSARRSLVQQLAVLGKRGRMEWGHRLQQSNYGKDLHRIFLRCDDHIPVNSKHVFRIADAPLAFARPTLGTLEQNFSVNLRHVYKVVLEFFLAVQLEVFLFLRFLLICYIFDVSQSGKGINLLASIYHEARTFFILLLG